MFDQLPKVSRFSAWRAGWMAALLHAWRETAAAPVRVVLTMLLVFLPVAALTGGVALLESRHLSPKQQLDARMGTGQAFISFPNQPSQDCPTTAVEECQHQIEQPPVPTSHEAYNVNVVHTPAREIPGWNAGNSNSRVKAVSQLVKSPVVGVTHETLSVAGGELLEIPTMTVSSFVDLGPKLSLVSGKWPTAPNEVLVTGSGIAHGLPSSGKFIYEKRVTYQPEDHDAGPTAHEVTVVGVAQASFHDGTYPMMVRSFNEKSSPTTFVVSGKRLVTWSKIQELNTYGALVTSRHVAENLPSPEEVSFRTNPDSNNEIFDNLNFFVTAFGLVLLITVLLVSPAFAVGLSRQRKVLAVLATNGAPHAMLCRVVLAQGIVQGVLAVLVSIPVSLVLLELIRTIGVHLRTDAMMPELQIPMWQIVAIAIFAIAAVMISAAIPARGVSHLDVMGTLRGQSVSRPPSRPKLAAGAILTLIASALMLTFVKSPLVFLTGAIFFVIGALIAVPAVITAAAHFSGRWHFTIRMALRDMLRHSKRAVPIVAAIMGASTLLVTVVIVATIVDAQSRSTQRISAPLGSAYVYINSDISGTDNTNAIDAAQTALREIFPRGEPFVISEPKLNGIEPGERHTMWRIVPNGCTPEFIVQDEREDSPNTENCLRWISVAVIDDKALSNPQIVPATAADVMRHGGVGLRHSLEFSDTVRIAAIDFEVKQNTKGFSKIDAVVTREATLSATHLEANKALGDVVMSSTTAKRLGLIAQPSVVFTIPPTDLSLAQTITRVQNSALAIEPVRVEQGVPSSLNVAQTANILWTTRSFNVVSLEQFLVLALTMLCWGLIIIVTIISSGLALIEQQNDLATLAAVGATTRIRRTMAATQAAATGSLGILLGIAFGGVAGASWVRMIRDGSETGLPWASFHWPWQHLVAFLLIPLIAAAVAMLFVYKKPTVTRRPG